MFAPVTVQQTNNHHSLFLGYQYFLLHPASLNHYTNHTNVLPKKTSIYTWKNFFYYFFLFIDLFTKNLQTSVGQMFRKLDKLCNLFIDKHVHNIYRCIYTSTWRGQFFVLYMCTYDILINVVE